MIRRLRSRRAFAPGLAVVAVLGGALWPGGAASGGSAGPNSAGGQAAPESTTLFATFSGSQDGGTRVLVSDHGNVFGFESPFGYEHINVGGVWEGYALCYDHPSSPSRTSAFDVASSEQGFGTPTSATKTATGASIVRRTSDGVLELKQDFAFKAADKRVTVQMTVKNLSAADVSNLHVRRSADFDVDTGGTLGSGSFTNWGARTRDSASVWRDPSSAAAGRSAQGLVLRALKGPGARGAVVGGTVEQMTNCASASDATPKQGDLVGAVHLDVATLKPGRSTVVKFDYVRT